MLLRYRLAVVPLRFALLCGVLAAPAALAQPTLFTPVPGADLAPRQAALLAALQDTPGFAAADVGRAHVEALLAGTDVAVALPGGASALLVFDRLERRGPEDASWFGRDDGGTTSGVLVVHGSGITGTVRAGGRLYALRPLTGGLHALARLDEAAFRDHGDTYGSFEAAEMARLARTAGAETAPGPGAQLPGAIAVAAPVVTVLVAYTPAARAAVADIGALVQLAVDETNQSYANSGVGARLALAYAYETSAPESGSMNTDLPRLRTGGDGFYDEVHALRAAYEADVVSLIGNYSDFCGIGYLQSTPDYAFSVTARTCATGYYSFGHEIGHNFGAHHDPAAGTNTTYPFGHGYVNLAAGWRTVMAYNNAACPGGSCTRVPYWSTPAAVYNGEPTGDATARHNARVLDQRAEAMAAFNASALAVAGGAGWRMLSAPVTGMTVADLAAQNLVQGVPDYYPAGATNLFTGHDGTAWVPPSGGAQVLAPGAGFLWYFYNQTFDPGGPSRSLALPFTLNAAAGAAAPSAAVTVPLHTAGGGWNLVGNPFATGLDLSGLPGWAAGGALASAVGQVWEAGPSSYLLTSALGNVVATWQGFLVENATATGLTIPASARTVGGVFHAVDPRLIAFELQGTNATTSAPVFDRAIVLYFHPDGTDGWDIWDASKLTPLSPSYALLAWEGMREGLPILKAQESRPLDPPAPFDVAMSFEAVGTTDQFTFRWPTFSNVPPTWAFVLEDLTTGEMTDLRTTTQYAFTAAVSPLAPSGGPPAVRTATTPTTRFVMHVNPGIATGAGPGAAPAAFALTAPSPNPAAGAVTVRFDVPHAADVTVEVLDPLGRRVAVLVDGAVAAGRHEVRLDASPLAAGVYVVRMSGGGFVGARRLTVAR